MLVASDAPLLLTLRNAGTTSLGRGSSESNKIPQDLGSQPEPVHLLVSLLFRNVSKCYLLSHSHVSRLSSRKSRPLAVGPCSFGPDVCIRLLGRPLICWRCDDWSVDRATSARG